MLAKAALPLPVSPARSPVGETGRPARDWHLPRAAALAVPAGTLSLLQRRRARGRHARAVRRAQVGYSQRKEEDDGDGFLGTTVLDLKGKRAAREIPRTPVTLLTGLHGAGKSSLLKHVLENQEGLRVAVVTDDVAALDIDPGLVKKSGVEVAEMKNGCVCCAAKDDLIVTVQELLNRVDPLPFHHMLIEMSGVGEPESIRGVWEEGAEVGMPATTKTEIKRSVTVIDATRFSEDWLNSEEAASRNEEDCKGGGETVSQLLAEQIERAEVVLINKADLASPSELATTEHIVRALNPKGQVLQTTFGRAGNVLPDIPDGIMYPEFGQGRHYRWHQDKVSLELRVAVPAGTKGKDVTFNIGRTWLEIWIAGENVPRLQGKLFGRLRGLDEWLWELGGEGEQRHVAVFLEKSQEAMWEDLWQKPRAVVAREDSGDEPEEAEAAEGVFSFVYEQRRPFSSERLQRLLNAWPLPDVVEDLESGSSASSDDVLKPVLRSRGSCWLDVAPLKAHEWVHAGGTLKLAEKDWWWAVLKESQLNFQVSYPGAQRRYEAVRAEKWDERWGDRRQELVFIGGPDMSEERIAALLDGCLLSDEELEDFARETASLAPPAKFFSIEEVLRRMNMAANAGAAVESEEAGSEIPGDADSDEKDVKEAGRAVAMPAERAVAMPAAPAEEPADSGGSA